MMVAGDVAVINAAKWGADSSWGLCRFDGRVLRHRPNAVFLEFAVNDADPSRHLSIEQSSANVRAMIARAQASGADVGLLQISPITAKRLSERPDLPGYFAAHAQVADAAGAFTIDLMHDWLRAMKMGPERVRELLPDGLHPGVTAAHDLIVPGILRALASPATSRTHTAARPTMVARSRTED
jgi:alpha-L-rhamnosidase/acyl-CoA thioesterase-1